MNAELLKATKDINVFREHLEEFVGNLPQMEFQNKKQIAQGYLMFDTVKVFAEAIVKLGRKGREHCAKAMVVEMQVDEVSSVDTAGKRFRIGMRGWFNRPAKSKKPEQYKEFLKWMNSDEEGKLFIQDAIDGGAFNKWCVERLEQGKELPPNVTHHSEDTVKVRALGT